MRKLCENYLFLTEFKCQTFIAHALSKNFGRIASVALEIVFKDDSIKKGQLNLRHTKDGWKVLLK